MKKEQYNALLKELEDIKREWENKGHLTKIDYIKFYIKYWMFNRKIERIRKRNK